MQTRRMLPNLLTIGRMLAVIPVVLLMLERTRASNWVAFFAFGLAALTDGLDGAVARRFDVVSSSGQFLDPLADKILVTASMWALVVVGRFPAWAAVVIVVREAAVTALRFVATRRGRGFPPTIAGKAKTGAQLFAVLFYILPGDALHLVRLVFLWIALALTVYSGAEYFRRAPSILGWHAR